MIDHVIDGDEVFELLDRVVAGVGKDFVYQDAFGEHCTYFAYEGIEGVDEFGNRTSEWQYGEPVQPPQPRCIVGQALFLVGAEPSDFIEDKIIDMVRIGMGDEGDHPVSAYLTDEAKRILAHVQADQDMRVSWGRAVEAARRAERGDNEASTP